MKKSILQFRMTAMAMMIGLLLGTVEKMYAYDFSAICETGQTLYYNITDEENHYVELTYPGISINYTWSNYTKPIGNIVLPSQVEHEGQIYSVKSIGKRAFYYCSGLTGSLSIPNTILTIGEFAFLGCNGLNGNLTLNNGLTSIGAGAFNGCRGLIGNLIIPNSVLTIDGNAFSGCSGFSGSLTIGDSVTTIGHGAFYGCSGFIGDLVIPNSVTFIGSNYEYPGIFQDCSGFNGTLTLSNSISIIGRSAFSGCSGFTGQLNIPNNVTIIGDESFFECNGFTGQLVIPNSVTYIGEGAFYNCSGFDGNLSIPSSVTTINRTDIGSEIKNPFYGTAWYNSQNDGVLYLDGWCLGYKGDINPVIIIPEGIIHIAGGAFLNCSFITSVSIPNSVTDIGQSAFEMCENLTSVSLSNSLTSISWGTFAYCINLNSIKLPNSITTIGDHAFRGCGFSTVTIPNSVTVIENYAFQNENLCSVVLGNSVVSIGESAFETPDVLRTVVSLSETPPLLGNFAFVINPEYYGVSGTVSIYVPYESLDGYRNASGWNEFESTIYPMSYTTIPAYNESDNHYRFIASPLVNSIAPTTVDNLITETAYDLYQFNPSDTLGEWQNYKAHTDDFNLVNGRGYLYANENEVNIIFKGAFNEDESKEVNLVYDADNERKCWNLVGNPFPCNAYLDREYYMLKEDGSGINPEAVPVSTPISPCTGVFVKAESEGETAVFTRAVP